MHLCICRYSSIYSISILFCVWHTHYRLLWRWGRRLELFRSASVPLMTGNHQWILFKLCSVGVGGSLLSVLTQFLSNINRSQYVVVDGCQIKLVNGCQECLEEIFWVRSCSFCTPRSFSSNWRTSFTVMLTTPLW